MTISQLIERLDLRVWARGSGGDSALAGCYIGDLLSRVISRAVPGGLWITIMNNINTAAVAVLADIPCILLAEGVEAAEELRLRCEEEGIWLLGGEKGAYDLAVAFSKGQA